MPRKYRPWSRAEYDRLEELVNAGWLYAEIAADLGRDVIPVRGTAQRLGLSSRRHQHWRRRNDWPEVDAIITDCIEAQLMTATQVATYLAAIGKPVSVASVYRRIEQLPTDVQSRAKRNGSMRRSAVCSRINNRRKVA